MEHYKQIKDYENYSISNYGRIRNDKTGRILKSGKGGRGYFQVVLHKNGIGKTQKIHRLVALAFIPNMFGKRTINHIDGVKTNNFAINLEWATDKENTQHAWSIGLAKPNKGTKHVNSKLTEEQVLEIRRLYKTGNYIYKDLGKMFGVSRQLIGHIVNRKKWTHV